MGLFDPPPDCVKTFPKGKEKRTYKLNNQNGSIDWICLDCAKKNGGVYDAAGNSQWEDTGKEDEFGDVIKCFWCGSTSCRVVHPRYFGNIKPPKPPEYALANIFGTPEPSKVGVFF